MARRLEGAPPEADKKERARLFHEQNAGTGRVDNTIQRLTGRKLRGHRIRRSR